MTAPDDLIELTSGKARASVARAGGEWREWSIGETPMLWTPDPAFWSQTAPVLFPVCGWTRDGQVRVAGKTYPLGLHGFANRMHFDVDARGADFVRLILRDDDATRAVYPFGFELSLEYRLAPLHFSVQARVRNTGQEAMPYAFGLHPGFRWPFSGGRQDDYAIVFDDAEKAEVPVIAPGGLFSQERRAIALEGARLALSQNTFAQEALCFLDARSRALRFTATDGRALRVEMEGFRHIVLWSRPRAPFLCIESWTGYGDPVGFGGELAAKPSMILLAPGEERSHAVRYSFESDGALISTDAQTPASAKSDRKDQESSSGQ